MVKITTNIEQAVECLNREALIGLPTETVYGLAGNIYSEKAVRKIFEMKQRPFFNPLIVHIRSLDDLPKVALDIPDEAYQLAEAFWPGPLTLVLNRQANIPDLITAGKNTVAVRVPNHPLALALLEALDFPLAAPSANPFGAISPTSAEHVANYFKDQLELVLDGGPCQRGIESTIIGFPDHQPTLYRLGSLALEEIESVVGPLQRITSNETSPDAPGMLSRHYAPATPTLLTPDVQRLLETRTEQKIGLLLFQNPITNSRVLHQEVLSPTGDLKEAAAHLYAALHRLDKMGLDVILAERFPDTGLGRSINDRLERATKV